jgi:3-methyladenine DNA glycosylase AlkD
MNAQEVLQTLESFGTDQNRKIYARHGVKEPMYGVSYGSLNALQKKVKKNHAIVEALWATGNHDARIFAMKIADPKKVTAADVERWVRDSDNYVLTDAVIALANHATIDPETLEQWTRSDNEWLARAGWHLIANLSNTNSSLPDSYFYPYLDRIANDIHNCQNRVREAMNNALINFGTRNPDMEARALAVADQIGAVYVDHGETGCKTPDAAAYIHKTNAHRRKRAMA